MSMNGGNLDPLKTLKLLELQLERLKYSKLPSDPVSPLEGQTWYRDDIDLMRLRKALETVSIPSQGGGEVVDTLGKYTETETLLGDVKLEAGTNIGINRSDPHNSLIISGVGGTGATYKPASRYVIYPGFYIYDNWDEAFELSAGSFAQLISTFNTLAGSDASFLFRNGSYSGSSSTPFQIDPTKHTKVSGEGWGTVVENTYSGVKTFEILGGGAWDGEVILKDLYVKSASGYAVYYDPGANVRASPVKFWNLNTYAKVGVFLSNPQHGSEMKNIRTNAPSEDNCRGIVIAQNHTGQHCGDFYMENLNLNNNVSPGANYIGLLFDATYGANTHTLEDVLCNYLYVNTKGGTESKGLVFDASSGGNLAFMEFHYTTLEGARVAIDLIGGATSPVVSKIAVYGGFGRLQGSLANWRATGAVKSCYLGDVYMFGVEGNTPISESGRSGLSTGDENIFERCIILQGDAISPKDRFSKFYNCVPESYFQNIDCVVNGMMREAGGPTASYYAIGEICHRTTDNTFHIKDSAGTMRQL